MEMVWAFLVEHARGLAPGTEFRTDMLGKAPLGNEHPCYHCGAYIPDWLQRDAKMHGFEITGVVKSEGKYILKKL